MNEMGFNTIEIDEKIEKVKSSCCLDEIKPVINKTLVELSMRGENKYVVVIDNPLGNGPVAFICTDSKKLITLTNRKHPILDFYDERIVLQESHSHEKSNGIEPEKKCFL